VTDAVEEAQPADDGALPSTTAKKSRSTRNIVEWVAIVVGALVVAVVVKTFLIQAFYIPSLSMYSTLDKGDRVLVNKVSYHLHDVHRGDIVVFKRPPNVADTAIKDLIKRVVGLPGDKIAGHDGAVYVNGKRLTEKYLDRGTFTSDFSSRTIPKNRIFVMGDNRGNSEDSRVFGPIDEDLVVGRAFVRVWPLQELHLF
jgi:signal peptidase I